MIFAQNGSLDFIAIFQRSLFYNLSCVCNYLWRSRWHNRCHTRASPSRARILFSAIPCPKSHFNSICTDQDNHHDSEHNGTIPYTRNHYFNVHSRCILCVKNTDTCDSTTIGTSSVTAYNATETFKTTAGTETDTETLIDTKTVTDTGTTVVTATTYIDQKKKKRDATVTSSSNTGIPTVTIISSTTVYSTTLTTTVFVTINPQANTAISTSTTSSTKQSPYESAYSVLLSAEDALAGRICRCIETPVFSTKTVTPSTTISIIATSISSVVATSIK